MIQRSVNVYRTQAWKDLNDAITPDIILIRQYRLLVDVDNKRKQTSRIKEYARIFYPTHVLVHNRLPKKKDVRDRGRRCTTHQWTFYETALEGNKKKLALLYNASAIAVCPHLVELIGALETGKLLVAAGSLKKLACMTARDILHLGNERNVFLYLQKKGPMPIVDADHRKLSNSIMKAARLDFFS